MITKLFACIVNNYFFKIKVVNIKKEEMHNNHLDLRQTNTKKWHLIKSLK